jgi:ribose-phosphate pyrophosphokinase
MKNLVIIGSIADSSFTEDIAHQFEQKEDYLDLISLKSFNNTEFCPRFIINEEEWQNVGYKLKNKRILIVSADTGPHTRNALAMHNCLIARAAKDNGASWVTLFEPDLFYSAQDRGPRPEHGITDYKRDEKDFKKFDGQPFSARLYADLLKVAGIDEVVTVHNHSHSVKNIFMDRLAGHFHNLLPADLYADYLRSSDIINIKNLALCAPDKGAVPFVKEVLKELADDNVPVLILDKERRGEQQVEINLSSQSPVRFNDIKGMDVVVIDDMVRSGDTIVQSCRVIRKYDPRRVVFFVTHFYSSPQARVKLNNPVIDEIVTTNTLPNILNRDEQGRLRKKIVVLKIGRWVSHHLLSILQSKPLDKVKGPLYTEDMSSKNPRWRGKLGPLFSTYPFP